MESTTTTLDPPTTLSATISRSDDGMYYVSDLVGVRYGRSGNPLMALIGWWWQIQDLLDVDEPTADPLASEIRAYRQALGMEVAS